jgi:hypothetical protein
MCVRNSDAIEARPEIARERNLFLKTAMVATSKSLLKHRIRLQRVSKLKLSLFGTRHIQ